MRQYDVVGIIPRFRSGYLPLIRPRSHYAERILKRRFHSENASSVFRPHFAERILKRRFHSESASSVFRPHFAGRILKRRFHSENASNVFRPHHAGENVKWKRNNHRSFWICVIGKLGQRKKKITWSPWLHRFRKAPFSKCFPSTQDEKPAFSNSSSLKSVFEKLRFGGGLVWTD